MKKTLVLAIALGVVCGSFVSSAQAGRTRMLPGTSTFYLRTTDAACQTGFALSIEDGPDAANCGYVDGGLPQEGTIAVLGKYTTQRTWIAQDGLPMTVDATRPVTTDITLKSFQPRSPASLGTGQAIFDVVLTGFSGGEQVVLGEAQESYVVTPGTYEYQLRFDVDIPDELHRTTVTSLEMTTVVRGPVLLHGAFSVDDPSSSINVPTLVKTRRTRR
ncbi:MAG TPA: hypothetical protein VG929_08320 [Actinomycetota bacterium]|nr:hypothetical protein [Actinomycetota bacterium]